LSAETIVRNVRFPSFPLVEEPEPVAPHSSALEKAEREREAARMEGLRRGREEGREAALAEWAPRLALLAAALERAIALAATERERLAGEISRAVPEAAVTIARKIIEHELANAEDRVTAVLQPIVRRLSEGPILTVRLAPDVAEALRAWIETSEQRASLHRVTIHADQTFARGDWVIETESGFLDGRLDTQLTEAHRVLSEPDA
jgi:flagellar biosynthesis/type III secretory pathway protein FliH